MHSGHLRRLLEAAVLARNLTKRQRLEVGILGGRPRLGRKPDGEGRALAQLALDLDGPAVALHDPQTHRPAEPGPAYVTSIDGPRAPRDRTPVLAAQLQRGHRADRGSDGVSAKRLRARAVHADP